MITWFTDKSFSLQNIVASYATRSLIHIQVGAPTFENERYLSLLITRGFFFTDREAKQYIIHGFIVLLQLHVILKYYT